MNIFTPDTYSEHGTWSDSKRNMLKNLLKSDTDYNQAPKPAGIFVSQYIQHGTLPFPHTVCETSELSQCGAKCGVEVQQQAEEAFKSALRSPVGFE